MGVARNILLWGSRSERLRTMLPRYRFVRRSVTRFMPGEEPADALNAAQSLKENGIPTVITHLGENLHTTEETVRVRDHYLDVLAQIHARGLDTHISVKLTELGLDQNPELCYSNMSALIEKAGSLKNFVWIDIEGSPYTTATIKLFERVRSRYSNTGLCLQAYLYRTKDDLQNLLPLTPRIRLVKGAYAEPTEIAFPEKRDTDENYFGLAKTLLEAGAKN